MTLEKDRPTIGVRMDAETYKHVSLKAEEQGRSRSNYVEQLIKEDMKNASKLG